MKFRRSFRDAALRRQSGSYLLEALIAILIFSFGILGLIGLLGSSIRITNDARYRTEAANLAGAMIADMWTMTAAQMDTQFGSGGTKLADWQAKAAALLPSATGANAPDGRSHATGTVAAEPYRRRHGEMEAPRRSRDASAPDDSPDREEPMNARRTCACRAASAASA